MLGQPNSQPVSDTQTNYHAFHDDTKLCFCGCVCVCVCVCVFQSLHASAWSSIKYLSDPRWPTRHNLHPPALGASVSAIFKRLLLFLVSGTYLNLNEEPSLSFVLDPSTRLNEAFRTNKNQMALQEHFWMFRSESFVCGYLHKIAIWVTGSRLSPAFQTAHLCPQLRRQAQYCRVPQKYYSISLYV